MEICTIYSLVLRGTNVLLENQGLSFDLTSIFSVPTATLRLKKFNIATAQSEAFKICRHQRGVVSANYLKVLHLIKKMYSVVAT